jgi:hypothetical protein
MFEDHDMTAKRTAAYLGGASLLAAWLASAASMVPGEPVVQDAPRAVQTAGTETLAADVQAQIARLRERLAAAPAPQEPVRNPFAFAERPQPVARRVAAAPAATPVLPAPPPEPPLVLIGIAEDRKAEGLVRIAVIATAAGDVLTVTAGQSVIGRYRVRTVDASSVELTDLTTGGFRRLVLR